MKIADKFLKDNDGFSIRLNRHTWLTLENLNTRIEEAVKYETMAKKIGSDLGDKFANEWSNTKEFYIELRDELINFINEKISNL
ncbi:MAG: hypothetical protein GY849_00670 [Deltaproteobacteria bacterium]|nr:hypothetical protein [Deltaproteobacteria bacterium]